MSGKNEDDPIQSAINFCRMTQCLIDITSKKLDALRTQCSTAEEITHKEIREAESKVIKLISRQLIAKAKLKLDADQIPQALREYPHTQQWLHLVGLQENVIKQFLAKRVTLEALLDMSEDEVRRLMKRYHGNDDDILQHVQALHNLKLWTEKVLQGEEKSDIDLHWSCYKSATNSPYSGNSPKFGHRQRPSTSSLPPELNAQSPQSPASPPTPPQSTPASPLPYSSPAEQRRRFTPPPTPPLVKTSGKGKFPTTPPPQKRNKLYPVFHPLTKSKSHESQLSNRVNQDTDISKYPKKKPVNLTIAGSYEAICKRRRSTEGSDAGSSSRGHSGQTSPLISSPKRSPPYKQLDSVSLTDEIHPYRKNQLLVPPISPKTPLGSRSMAHQINHRFANTFKITTCDYCQKQMFLGFKCKECKFQTKPVFKDCDICHKNIFLGKVCRDCKLKFHRDCAAKAAPSCGLPNEFVDHFLDSLKEGSPNIMRKANHTMSLPVDNSLCMRQASSVPAFQVPDSSSNTSSCNSSTPSSPALVFTSCPTPPSPQPSPFIQITTSDTQFKFPDIIMTSDSIGTASSLYDYQDIDVINTNTSNDSDKSDKTLIEGPVGHIFDRVDSQESEEGQSWKRVNSISLTLKEWDIPYEELQFGDAIGCGRFGVVHRGNWHGDVAIKMLAMDPNSDNQSQLQSFKLEVAMLRKTRHENLVLFMGACMKPPHLAIVTSLCKGQTLYTHIHVRKEKFALNKSVIIATQIAQGMGYLHAKSIIHKDLKTKNIFLEAGKTIITDFGLFSVTKLCHGNRKGEWLTIPPGWLCYLSPEIMRALQAGTHKDMDLPFTQASDVYAFGTLWYELLCGEWPFKNQPPEAIIWQVGKGMRQSLSNVQASRDVKDVLMQCWSFKPDDRPDFSILQKTLEKLPKKRLARSPSHPIQLSRSAESVF